SDVEILHHANGEYVEEDGVCNNGICFVNDVTIWTAGVQPPHIVRDLPFETDSQQKIIVNDFFQIQKRPDIYVLRDNTSSEDSQSGQLAGQQGEQVAVILEDILLGKTPKKPRAIRLRGPLGSLGKSDGFGSIFSQSLTGLLPRITKSGVLWLQKRH